MNDVVTKSLDETLSGAVKAVADGITNAVAEYGPDAVELALMAYRIEAAQQVATGCLMVGVAVVIAFAYRKFWEVSRPYMGTRNEEPYLISRVLLGAIGGAVSIPTLFAAVPRIADISAWVAIFGYPELRIATKALEAAGLM